MGPGEKCYRTECPVDFPEEDQHFHLYEIASQRKKHDMKITSPSGRTWLLNPCGPLWEPTICGPTAALCEISGPGHGAPRPIAVANWPPGPPSFQAGSDGSSRVIQHFPEVSGPWAVYGGADRELTVMILCGPETSATGVVGKDKLGREYLENVTITTPAICDGHSPPGETERGGTLVLAIIVSGLLVLFLLCQIVSRLKSCRKRRREKRQARLALLRDEEHGTPTTRGQTNRAGYHPSPFTKTTAGKTSDGGGHLLQKIDVPDRLYKNSTDFEYPG